MMHDHFLLHSAHEALVMSCYNAVLADQQYAHKVQERWPKKEVKNSLWSRIDNAWRYSMAIMLL